MPVRLGLQTDTLAQVMGGAVVPGTEVITTSDGTLAAVLGASPGASTSVSIMLGIMTRAFAPNMPAWMTKLTEMIPSYGRSISDDATLCYDIRRDTAATLHIVPPTRTAAAQTAQIQPH